MNQYKDTTLKPNTLETQNKPPIKRVIHGLLDCLLMAGMILFVLLLATYCQPARATYENTSPVLEKTSPVKHQSSNAQAYRQALHEQALSTR